ncbi:class I SAM-dependent methyltransferase [Niallia sp. JL1B1071]|uniref:class I SAM-dependent methyltransferase n=1 Tax=Niallia tiangongensis TaxID=3237105 RepID=UPI0037DDBB7D
MQNEFVHKTKEYAIGRPSYTKEILNIINELGIKKQSIIVDIGAGTGLLTNMLGELDCTILAIEPNEDMH